MKDVPEGLGEYDIWEFINYVLCTREEERKMLAKKSLNRVEIVGRLGRDPELRITPTTETAVATFSVATDESYKDKAGETVKQVEWHNVVFWGLQGATMVDTCKKGDLVRVVGKLRTRSWEKDGIKRSKTEIVAFEVKPVETTAAPRTEPVEQPSTDGDIPF